MSDDLKDFLADLVTDEIWSATALARLFSLAPATWIAVPALCEGLPDAVQCYETLMPESRTDLMGMWLPHPVQAEQAFLILFYHDEEMSSTVSLVTRAYLQQLVPAGSMS